MDHDEIYRKNFRIHLVEGALYLSTNAILYAPVFFPTLITKLGGSNITVGLFPVTVYFAFLLPQVLSEFFVRTRPYRKPMVIALGWVQRLLILLLAVILTVFGKEHAGATLVALIVVFSLNQIVAGIASPAWFDLVAKTTRTLTRGKLMGSRTSFGALLGLVNSSLIVFLLASTDFPFNYSVVLLVAFLYQLVSLILQNRLREQQESTTQAPLRFSGLVQQIKGILQRDVIFRRFLGASALLTVALVPMNFFMVSAFNKFSLDEVYVGWFTLTIVLTQIFSGALLGMLGDRKGYRAVLMVCASCVAVASLVAFLSNHPLYYFGVFLMAGIYLGGEFMMRYNFAIECSSESGRALYIGMMNAWLAPWYWMNILGGWIADRFGYDAVFLSGAILAVGAIMLVLRTAEPRTAQLALSPK
jgi:MFS family permease